MLFKKLWRTMGLYKAQFIFMIIMITLGVGVFVGFNMEWGSIEKVEIFFLNRQVMLITISCQKLAAILQQL